MSASSAPTGADREALAARHAELSSSLLPGRADQRRAVITLILAGFATYGMSEQELDMKIALYDEALRDEPVWAIDQARKTFGKGGWRCNWDGRGCPSSASVAAECKFITLAVEEELYRIGLILNAELVDTDTTEDERAAALAHWATIRAGIARSNVVSERTDEEIIAERAEMQRANAVVRARAGLGEGSLIAQPESAA
jgi:hypothetical protein